MTDRRERIPLVPLSREEILDEHIRHTFPESADGFVGKEHFWILGQQAGIQPRKVSGTLFTELCFPVLRNVRKGIYKRHDLVNSGSLGLIVRTRADVGIPPPPILMSTGYAADHVLVHISGWREACLAVNDAVIQIKGVAELDDGERDLGRFFTPLSRAALRSITPRLREFS